jgi:hypothetical protein
MSLLLDSLESKQVQFLRDVGSYFRFYSVDNREKPHSLNFNFLWHFITNYAEITKGFMRLLKKGVPFHWDEASQCSFEALKHALTFAPLLRPPNYNKDFLLYLATVDSTIGMVLVQEDDFLEEHIIYYLEMRPRLDQKSTTPTLKNLRWQQYMLSNGSVTISCFARPPSLSL